MYHIFMYIIILIINFASENQKMGTVPERCFALDINDKPWFLREKKHMRIMFFVCEYGYSSYYTD